VNKKVAICYITADLALGTYLELNTWYPYENSERYSTADGTVPVKVFTVRNFIDIRKSEIFKTFYHKNFHKCSISVRVLTAPPFVNPPKRVWNNDSGYQDVYVDGWEIEMVKIMGNALNVTLGIDTVNKEEYDTSPRSIYVGGYAKIPSMKTALTDSSPYYITLHSSRYTPHAVIYPSWSRFFQIFSVYMWICFALLQVLAGITVRCISNYGHK
jgi:hypothetical protein